jgi:opacity protein-like surface antigen
MLIDIFYLNKRINSSSWRKKMVKNILSSVTIIALASSMSLAGGQVEAAVEPVVEVEDTSKYFIGIMGGYEHVAVDTTLYNIISDVETFDDSGQNNLFIGVKAGYMYNFNHRVDLAAEKTNHSNGLVAIPISLNYTYVADQTIQDFHPFVGAGIGMIKWRENIICDNASKKMDIDGNMWQIRAGLLYEIDQQTEVEVFYRYSQANFDTEYCSEGVNEISIDLDNVKRNGIFIGANYKF